MLPVDKGVLDDASVAANGRFRLTATLRHETATVRVNIWDFAGILTGRNTRASGAVVRLRQRGVEAGCARAAVAL